MNLVYSRMQELAFWVDSLGLVVMQLEREMVPGFVTRFGALGGE